MRDSGNRSTGFAEDACTRTSTPSSGTTGLSISAMFSAYGEPGLSHTTALMLARSSPITIASGKRDRRVMIGHSSEISPHWHSYGTEGPVRGSAVRWHPGDELHRVLP